MIIDLATTSLPGGLDCDVCVVGAGAAGISLTRQLKQAGYNVVLVESGGLDFETDTQHLYDGPNLGMTYYDLVDARLRFFGGTTNIWGGRCTPMEPIDFQRRDWVPDSGWPISIADLQQHYEQAHADLALGEYCYNENLWQQFGRQAPAFDPDALLTRFWRFDTVKERFSAQRCQDLLEAEGVTVLLHANVVHIQANEHASAITHLTVSSLDGRLGQLRARAHVLACGGIENPRLLLTSNDVEATGIGNRYDQVGRYFMEHQHGRAGQVHTENPYRLWEWFRKRKPTGHAVPLAPTLLPGVAAQQQHEILNTALTFKLQRDPEQGLLLNDRIYRKLKHQLPPDRTRRRLWHTYRDIRGWIQNNIKPVVERSRRAGSRNLYLMARAEQAPNPASRVILSDKIDGLGMRRAALDWQLCNQDKDTIRALSELCDREFRRLGVGSVSAASWLMDSSPAWPVDPTVSKHPIGGYHHMGTTRMSNNVQQGVVNAQCQVHGYANLFVAGSSVFTTGGWANPTLTILALTHRLGEHLCKRLSENMEIPSTPNGVIT